MKHLHKGKEWRVPGGLPYKRVGGDHWKFQKEPIRGSKNLFWERGLKCFSPPQEVPILKQHIFSWLIFQPSTIKGNVKAPSVDILRLNIPRGTKTVFLSLKGTLSAFVFFIWKLPPGWVRWGPCKGIFPSLHARLKGKKCLSEKL